MLNMKAFVYSKTTNKKIAILTNVVEVRSLPDDKVVFVTASGEEFTFDTKTFKATAYQN